MNHPTLPSAPSAILLLDDHELVLEGLKKVLEEMPEVRQADTAANCSELLCKIRQHPYDICFIDIELSGENGLDAIQAIRRLNHRTAVIVCTMHEEVWTLHALLKMRPDGIVLKASGTKAIKQAILAARQGKKYYCPRFEQMYRGLENAKASYVRKNVPTSRELEVLHAIADGLSTEEISERLCLSENTIETYRKNLMTKLEAHNMADLVVKALGKGFLELAPGKLPKR